jgi:hypothetical protein
MSPFIKAKFKGVFKKTKSHYVGNFVHSDFDWKYLEITDLNKLDDFDPETQKTHDFRFYKKIASRKFWKFGKKTEIFIPIEDDRVFSGTIYNVLIKNIKLTNDSSSLLGADWREAVGDIYFQLEPTKKIKDHLLTQGNTVSGVNIIGDGSHVEVENKQNNYVSGVNNLSGNDAELNTLEQNNSINSSFNNSTTNEKALPISQTVGRWSKWLFRILIAIILILTLMYLWQSNRSFFYALASVGILWLVTRFINLGRILSIIGSLLLFGIIGYFILKLFYNSSSGIIPVKNRDGSIKMNPPKQTDTNGDGKTDDEILDKEINWYDFSNEFYSAKYSTSVSSFEHSNDEQAGLRNKITTYNSSLEFYTQFYAGLFKIDQEKIRAIAKIFSDSASKKNMDASQTAEMVVTFIQEIPYYLVHEGSCVEAMRSGNSFMRQYHQQNKPCLPNILAGVQSPYEFLHNLKGDCDTRSLLAFSILKELNIAASVWISETYGHSILGVGVPVGHGIHKEVNGVSHYGVELTAKGFRLGMVAPENNNSYNWDISIYFNH